MQEFEPLPKPQAKRQSPAMLVHTGKLYGSATEKIPTADDPALYHGPGMPLVRDARRCYDMCAT